MRKRAHIIKNFLIISRANIQIASLPTASLGVTFSSHSWDQIFNIQVLVYILLFFLILTYSCNINCMNDVEVDQRFKRYMSDAVRSFNPSALKCIIAVEVLSATALIIALCFLKRNAMYSVAGIGILCGYMYSAPPTRLKKRGLLSPLPVMFGLYYLPILAGGYIVSERISIFIALFALGYALVMQGITFINTCEDYSEDKISGIKTLAHVVGVKKTLKLASAFVLIGGILDLALILFYKLESNSEKGIILFLIMIGVFFFGISVFFISRTLYSISISEDPELVSKKHAGKMRWWFISTRYPLFVVSLLLIL